jgi:hypothetical protein
MARYTIDEAGIAALPGLPSIDGVMSGIAHEILDDAKNTVLSRSYQTGALYESGDVDGGRSDYTIGFGTDHAAYVEFGTRYMNAEPYLRPAALVYRGAF